MQIAARTSRMKTSPQHNNDALTKILMENEQLARTSKTKAQDTR